jgi:hypothetical protein
MNRDRLVGWLLLIVLLLVTALAYWLVSRLNPGSSATLSSILWKIAIPVVGWFVSVVSWRVNRDKFYTSFLLGATAALIIVARDVIVGLGFFAVFIAVTLLRRFDGGMESRVDSKANQ